MRSSLSTLLLFAFVTLFCFIGPVHSQEFHSADVGGFGGLDDEIAIPLKKGPKGPLRFGKRAPGGPLRFGKRRADLFQRYFQRVILPTIFDENQNSEA